MVCPRCGAVAPDDARFCASCGNELATGAAREERKLVSILFVDIVGSTAHADGADPEDVRDRNQLYYDEVRSRIEQYGGTLEKYIGDAVMAVFGAPLARSDDAERAVRASLSVLEGIRELNERHPGIALDVRVGVTTGEAIVAVDAAPEVALATGDVVNTAARLQTAAPPGHVIVDAQSYRLTRHAFAFEAIPRIEAKGKREPVEAWLVGEALGTPAGRPTSETPLVGRDHELSLIASVWERAVTSDHPHLVTVFGPAGIGKSRLAHEVAEVVRSKGGRELWGRSLPYEEQSPFRAAAEMVRTAAGIFEAEPVADARGKLAKLAGSLFPEPDVAEETRYLSLLLGLGLDEPPDEPVHLLFAMRQLIEHVSERDPLLLVFEDLHWADDALLDLIDYLVAHVRDHRVVFLALARPEFLERRPTWGAGMIGHTTLPLEALTPGETAQVVGALLSTPDAGAVERVVATAGGNPLFIEELVAALEDDPNADELPATVRAAIAARIDALPPLARTALLNASVIGVTFWRGVVEGLGGIEDIDGALDALEARGLVHRRGESRVEGDVEYSFKHILTRDTAYGTLPRARRRELHAAAAAFIEDATSGSSELAWLLAYHWREAGEPERAVGYLLAAAARARDALATEETYDLYTRALELAGTDEDRRRIRLERGRALEELEDYARADRELAELLPELDGVDEIEGLLARGHSTLWTEQSEETLAIAARAVQLVAERDVRELEGPALALLSQGYGMRGNEGDLDEALTYGNRALDAWVPGTRLSELAEHYHLHADVYYWTGGYERALELSRLSAETGGLEPHSAEFVLRGTGMRGLILAGMGRYEEALAAADAAMATGRRLGRPDDVVLNYSTMPLREVFAVDEALRRSETVVDRLGPSDFNMPWMNARADLIGAHLLGGAFGLVEREWPSAWEDALAVPAWEHWLITGRLAAYRAEWELEAGQLDDAVTWAGRAIDTARGVHRRKYEAIALTLLGRALTAQGQGEAAAVELASAVEVADALGSPLLRWQARAGLAKALSTGSNGADPEGPLREAAAIVREVAASLSSERGKVYLAAPQVAEVLEAAG
jgi:class 3 adenylate cyclase/tetratricopeptide (TPR) repeat protein